MADAPKTVYVDGTTSTGHYATLNAAFVGEVTANANLVTAEIAPLHIEISLTTADTTPAVLTGMTTDATHYVHIYTTAEARHAGVWSDSKYRLDVDNAAALDITCNCIRIDGLQIRVDATDGSSEDPLIYNGISSAADLRVSNCILVGDPDGAYAQVGIGTTDAGGTIYVYNCVLYGFYTTSATSCVQHNGTGTCYVYSVTGHGGETGFWNLGGTGVAKNSYFGGGSYGDWNGTVTKTNCAASDLTADDTPATDCINSVAYNTDTFVNVTPGAEDFRLALDGLSPLQGAGVNTSGESAPLNFTVDIANVTRSDWSIGAFDIPGGSTTPLTPTFLDTLNG